MNTLTFAAAAALAAAALPAAASAQDGATSPIYGTLGYAYSDGIAGDPVNAHGVQGRLGARLSPYFGAEGELTVGVKHDRLDIGGTPVDVRMQHQAAIYGVGFLPLRPNFDLLARIGYGDTKYRGAAPGVFASNDLDSWNYGVGAEYRFDHANGVRADFTREEFRDDHTGAANVWSVAFTRRF